MSQDNSHWFYLSFADGRLPKGSQFLGGCYVRVTDEHRAEDTLAALAHPRLVRELDEQDMLIARAVAQTHRLGINPGGEVQVTGPLPADALEATVPPEDRERLLTREEIEAHG